MKKVLAFVLVLAMVLGSVSMAFAATYSDDAAITNKEAVAVLSAAGVLEGDSNGFRPADGLTRAEGAAIVARMLLGKAEAAKLTTVVGPFSDVPATHWAAGYISYAVSQGLIDGYGNGNFGPEDPLTVAQFGKMMLTALGYKSANEGFTGANWETNVGSVMVKAGLTDGLTLSGSNLCIREVAAQVALNTLKAGLVKYEGTPVTVSTGNVTVSTGQSAAKADDWQSGDAQGTYKGETKANNGTARFMNRYQKDLKLGATETDVFGRPDVNKWTFKNKSVYTAKSSSNLVAKYTTKVSNKTLYKALKDLDAVKSDIKIETYENSSATKAALTAADITTLVKDTSGNFGSWADGAQIEVYYNSTDKKVTIVKYDYYLVQADADYNTSKEYVKVSAKDNALALTASNAQLKKEDFDVTGVKADDYLIVTAADGVVKSVAPATKVSGAVDTYTAGSDITVDGTKYTKSGTSTVTFTPSIGSNLTLIVDPNNFIVGVTEEVSSTQYVYIRATGATSSISTTYIADAFFTDGTKKEITLNKIDGASVNGTNVTADRWYNYSVLSNGKYNLKSIAVVAAPAAGQAVTAGTVTKGAVDFAASQYKASNNTVFVVVKDNGDTSVYTGYKTVPGTAGTVTIAAVSDKASGFAKYVMLNAKGTGATYTGAGTSDYAVLYGTGSIKTVYVADDKSYSTYAYAFVNGAPGAVEFDSVALTAPAIYSGLSYNEDGRIDGKDAVLADAFAQIPGITTGSGVVYKSGVLEVGGTTIKVADGAAAYITDGNGYSEVAVDKIKANMEDNSTYNVYLVYDNSTDKNAKAIYFVEI